MAFGDNIRTCREELNMTQEELSSAIDEDLSRQSVSKWERGEAYPDVENLLKLSSILGSSLDDLFEDELRELSAAEDLTQKKNRDHKGKWEEVLVCNKLPVLYKKNDSCLQITNIMVLSKPIRERTIRLEFQFEGLLLGDTVESIDFKIFDAEGVSVKNWWFNISADKKGERFKSTCEVILPEPLGDRCTVELL